MAEGATPEDHWKRGPEAHDYPAAANYLSLLFPAAAVEAAIASFRAGEDVEYAAKDLLRAADLPLLPPDDTEVKKARKKVKNGGKLSPVLLLRGDGNEGVPLIVADGYHRICASYHLDEGAPVPGRIADVADIPSERPSAESSTSSGAAMFGVPLLLVGKLIATSLLALCLLEVRRVLRRRRR